MKHSDIVRFNAKIDKSRGACGCWLWTAGGNGRGYGQFRAGRLMRAAHRVAYMLATGEKLRRSQLVLHTCDTPLCCNPLHLVSGTQQENMAHRAARGRNHLCGRGGARHYKTKFTTAQVAAIRSDTRSQQKIADDYGVNQSVISRLKSRRTWRDV